MVLLPLLLLGLSETGLRLAGYGYPTNYFKRARIQGQDVLVENHQFGLRFFSSELARNPAPVVMPATKPAGTCRIFLLGESAALGDPRPAYGMGRYLEVLLRERFPEAEFEVVCVAMAAINSHAILPIARECARQQADFWILYLGNNEMVGPFGPATVFGRQAPSLALVRWTLALQTTRLGQWIANRVSAWGMEGKRSGPWMGLGMFAEQQVAADDPRREIALGYFAKNLDDILALADEGSCPVVLSTVAVNLRDCAPFASAHAAGVSRATVAEFEALRAAGVTNTAASLVAEALASFERARSLDPAFAEVHFRLGQCLLKGTNRLAAQEAFALARDLDALPFRADSRINGVIREAADRHRENLRLVLADEELAGQAVDGVPGAEFFFEHVHFSFAGNYRVARALAEAVAAQLPASLTRQPVQDWPSQETCERRLALTYWNRAGVLRDVVRRIQGAPFSRQANHEAQLQQWQTELNAVTSRLTAEHIPAARAIYREALLRMPRDHRLYEGYAEFLEGIGDLEAAVAQWEAVRALLPHHFVAYVHAGRLLGRQKQWGLAEERLRTALTLEPRSGEAHLELGRVLAGRGELVAAVAEYREAERWQPANAQIFYHLADVLARQENRAGARDALARAAQLDPSFWEARYLLGVELAMSNRIPEARQEFEAVLRWRPDHVLARINLGIACIREGNVREARAQFEEALRLDPQNERARQHLARLEAMVRDAERNRP